MGTGIFRALALLLALAGFFAGLVFLRQWSQGELRSRDRYVVAFTETRCAPPAGLGRQEFLEEVQYLARLPDQLRLLDDELPGQLAKAFAGHPWVEKVEEVAITPPRQIDIRLRYRVPVLAVRVGESVRAVDASGILLPRSAAVEGLPVFPGAPAPPKGPAGTRWGDPAVETAAKATGR